MADYSSLLQLYLLGATLTSTNELTCICLERKAPFGRHCPKTNIRCKTDIPCLTDLHRLSNCLQVISFQLSRLSNLAGLGDKGGKLVLFGQVSGKWWNLFCGGKKVGKQCGSFLHGICYCIFVDSKVLFLFVNSAFVQRESDY